MRSAYLRPVACVVFLTAMAATAQLAPVDISGLPIAPGDRVRLLMREDPEVQYTGEVSAVGTVPVPYLGEFAISGLTPLQAEELLATKLTEDLYEVATVTVTIVKKMLGRVYVYGAVKTPGVVLIPDVTGLTILQLITQIGGLSRWSDPSKSFILRRSNPGEAPTKVPLDLEEIFQNALPNSEGDVQLQSNDVVCIPGLSGGLFDFLSADEAEVFVAGEVRSEEAIVRFAPGEKRTLVRAIMKAGGFSQYAQSDEVQVIRYGTGDRREEYTVNVENILEKGELNRDIDIEHGDMIIVPQKTVVF